MTYIQTNTVPRDFDVSWAEFKARVGDLIARGQPMFCRGHCDDAWTLRTTFHRWSARTGMTLAHYLDVVIPEVYRDILPQLPFPIAPPSRTVSEPLLTLLAVLQHHGFPTPLLDWTWSPYIAAYFAFRDVKHDGHSSDHVRVILFDIRTWTQAFAQPVELTSATPFVSMVRPFALGNPRVVAQQAIFTLTNVDDMETHIRRGEPQQGGLGFLYSFRLSVKERTIAMRDLQAMGITEASLFPGLDGLCRGLADAWMKGEVGATANERVRRFIDQASSQRSKP